MSVPHRRHHLTLDLEADSLVDLVGVLHYLADELEVEGRDQRDIRSAGYATTYVATLRTDPTQTGDRYRQQLTRRHDEGDTGK